ncbi:unnamed protein product [Boreogadus saida]
MSLRSQSIVIARGVIETAMTRFWRLRPKPQSLLLLSCYYALHLFFFLTEEELHTSPGLCFQRRMPLKRTRENGAHHRIRTSHSSARNQKSDNTVTDHGAALPSSHRLVSVEERETSLTCRGIEHEHRPHSSRAMSEHTAQAKKRRQQEEVEATPPLPRGPTIASDGGAAVSDVVETRLRGERQWKSLATTGPAVSTTKDAEPKCEEAVGAALPTLPEEPQTPASPQRWPRPRTRVSHASATDTKEEEERAVAAERCAEVIAQVNEIISEAVKEIEPISSEITLAS